MASVPTPEYKPFIPSTANVAEFTVRAVVMGALLGMIFGASSLYLVLKVGLTVSASIPVAVIAITLFRLFSKSGGRDSTILENNIVQTAGSAGESIAFGLGVTMPAILILGFDLEIARVMLVAVLGALLGILMMIPLRRTLIVARHGQLKYPEGTACAEVLKAAEISKGDSNAVKKSGAAVIFLGFGIGLIYKASNVALKGWKDVAEKVFGPPLNGGSVGAEVSPELLGVGYIIGPRIAAIMAAGGVMAYLLLIPLIKFFGDALATPLAPGAKLIHDMSPNQIRGAYVLYIGAGAVAAGGIISMARAMPTIWHSLKDGLRGFSGGASGKDIKRTDQDIPMKWVLVGALAIIVVIMLASPLNMNLLGALLILIFGFLFATVSSQLTGEIGSSSNPISHDGSHAAIHLSDLLVGRLDRRPLLRHRTIGRCDRMYRIQQCRHHLARFENRFPGRCNAASAAVCDPDWRACFGGDARADFVKAQRCRHHLCADCPGGTRPQNRRGQID